MNNRNSSSYDYYHEADEYRKAAESSEEDFNRYMGPRCADDSFDFLKLFDILGDD